MDIIDLREYLLSLPLVEECQPFGDDAVVYKVGGRMFACYVLEHTERIAVKCNPDRAIVLRDNELLLPKEMSVLERFERCIYHRQHTAVKSVWSNGKKIYSNE